MSKHKQHTAGSGKYDADDAPAAWVQALRFAARRGREIKRDRQPTQETPAKGDA